MFENCLLDMIYKNVKMKNLFESDILNHVLEFIEWPDNHHNIDRILSPYNEPFFQTRFKYDGIFKKLNKIKLNPKTRKGLKSNIK